MPSTKRRYAPLKEASEYSRLSVKTLRRYIVDGRLTGYRADPKLIRIDLNELDKLIRPIATR